MKVSDILTENYADMDYDKYDAARDDFLDGYNKWLDGILDKEFVSVYSMIEDFDSDHPIARRLHKLVTDPEDSYVHKSKVREFAMALRKNPDAAVKKYVEYIDDLRDDPHLQDEYADDKSFRADPMKYYGLRNSDFA